jgi:hypothetical protein
LCNNDEGPVKGLLVFTKTSLTRAGISFSKCQGQGRGLLANKKVLKTYQIYHGTNKRLWDYTRFDAFLKNKFKLLIICWLKNTA